MSESTADEGHLYVVRVTNECGCCNNADVERVLSSEKEALEYIFATGFTAADGETLTSSGRKVAKFMLNDPEKEGPEFEHDEDKFPDYRCKWVEKVGFGREPVWGGNNLS